jgi:CheY-like chemotaxis protein
MNTNPIFIVSEDKDDWEFMQEAWEQLNYSNALKFFENGEDMYDYMKQEKVVPFIIISDVKMPKMNGFDLKKKLHDDPDLTYPSIPFVLFSDSASRGQIEKSYDLGINGFFVKDTSIEGLKKTLVDIIEYWGRSETPS